ncbi:MAG: hypothetical protein IMW98_04595 [Firmicutes bacterium]|nr:hypothetical protein [Bacillota bacterium]
MDILVSRDTAQRLLRELQAAGGEAVRIQVAPDGSWQLSFDRVRAGDHTGVVAGVPFAVDAAAAEEAEQVMVAWTDGRFIVGPLLNHDCGYDVEIRE